MVWSLPTLVTGTNSGVLITANHRLFPDLYWLTLGCTLPMNHALPDNYWHWVASSLFLSLVTWFMLTCLGCSMTWFWHQQHGLSNHYSDNELPKFYRPWFGCFSDQLSLGLLTFVLGFWVLEVAMLGFSELDLPRVGCWTPRSVLGRL